MSAGVSSWPRVTRPRIGEGIDLGEAYAAQLAKECFGIDGSPFVDAVGRDGVLHADDEQARAVSLIARAFHCVDFHDFGCIFAMCRSGISNRVKITHTATDTNNKAGREPWLKISLKRILLLFM